MFDHLLQFSLRNKVTVLLVTLAIGLWSAFGLKDLSVDAVPDITNVQVQVNVKTTSLDPQNIELQITRNMEIEFSGIPRLMDMRSISKFGLAQVTLVFEEGTDIYWARQQVAERIRNIGLPAEAQIELAPITTGLGEVFMYTLDATPDSPLSTRSEKERLTELRTIQDYVVKPLLKRVPGVADVDSNGGFVKQVHINFLPTKLEQFGLTTNTLFTRLESLGIGAGGGYIQTNNEQVIVRTDPEKNSLDKISAIPLGVSPLGRPITLSEVAKVRVDHSLRVGAATWRGREAVLGTVLMRVGSNGRSVVMGVEKALEDLKLPKGIKFIPLYTRKFLVDSTIKTVSTSLVEGAILVILVLLVLLGNMKAALIVALAIPVSMLVAVKGMNLLGITGNLMSLGAIDFGLLVDGSVVIIESVLAHMALKKSLDQDELVRKSSLEVMGPVVAGIILIMAVYLPILTLEGVEGKMFRPMAITVLLALGASLLLAIFVMPVLASFLLKQNELDVDHDTWFFKHAKNLFLPLLKASLKKPLPFFISASLLLILAAFLGLRLGTDFIPELDEGDAVLGLTRNSRISIDASVKAQLQAEKLILKFPEVTEVFARLGTPESATDPMGINLSDTFLILEKDRSRWRFNNKDDLLSAVIKELQDHDKTTEVSVTQPIAMRFNEMLEGSRADISLRIMGPELSPLFEYGKRAQKILAPIRGVESLEQDPLTALRPGPVLDISPDFKKLALYGITVDQVNKSVSFSLAGKEVGSYIEQNIRFPIIVHLDEALRDRPNVIRNLPIELPLGGTIPLGNVVDIKEEEKITTIARSWGKRYSAISINVRGRDIGSLVQEAKNKIRTQLGLPPGYETFWGGQFKNMERANARLMIIVPLTLLAVFIILLRVFGGPGPAVLVFSSVPFAGVGGIFALWIRDLNFSVSAGVGFIALIGIALLNSLVLMNVLLHQDKSRDLEVQVCEGTLSRLRPVLMTALVAGLGFIPMAFNTGLGAEVQRPLATVVIGGLMTSTFLTLILLPAAYLHWKRRQMRIKA
jgi:cobalt-zinc-cadmium resistance protein CzcA